MTREDFEAFKYFILGKNPYFSRGYANVYKDDTTQAIWARNGKDVQPVLPNDMVGNYFYLRNEAGVKHEAMPAERLADSGTQRLLFTDMVTVQLVAVVNNADEYILVENLRNTAMQYQLLSIEPVSSKWNREQVIIEELAKMRSDDIQATLQRLKNETVVRLTLKVSKIFVPGNCINDPIIY